MQQQDQRTSSKNLGDSIMVETTSKARQKGINHAPTAMSHMGIITVVPHSTELCNGKKSDKHQDNKLQGGQCKTPVAPESSAMDTFVYYAQTGG